MFITFEGCEGSGKSTQVKIIHEWLLGLGCKVISTREPGGTYLGQGIRQLLLDGAEVCSWSELFMFAADRAEHVKKVIKPALADGAIVLCDRFSDSTVAYQHYGRGLDRDLVEAINQIASQGLKPDLTILLDLPAEIGLIRAKARKGAFDRLESMDLEFHNRITEGFRAIAQAEQQRVKIVKADRQIAKISSEIKDYVGCTTLTKWTIST